MSSIGNYSRAHLSLLYTKVAHEYQQLGCPALALVAEQNAKDLLEGRDEPRSVPTALALKLHRDKRAEVG